MQNSHENSAISPTGPHNRLLLEAVSPRGYTNPVAAGRYNLVVVGGGTAGLVAAAGASSLGAKVALVERRHLGGDCLNFGCVPSKALLHEARMLWLRQGSQPAVSQSDFQAVMERVRSARSVLAHHDSVERFSGLGVDVFLGDARFTGPRTLAVAGQSLRFSNCVIATGTRPVIPSIPGLEGTGFLTNESVFELSTMPRRLCILGGGPIGCELGQAFGRLGVEVTLVESGPRLLPRDDEEASEIILRTLSKEGVHVRTNSNVQGIETSGGHWHVRIDADDATQVIECDQLLVCAGRTPNVAGLNLEAAGVEYDEIRGVHVDATLRTSNPRIYAAGDVASPYRFTHAADVAARIVIQNALFGFAGRRKTTSLVVPWCTYTDPEVAHVGITPSDARRNGVALDTIRIGMDSVDRAVIEGETEGFLKVHLARGTDRMLGATIVCKNAGEMIGEITLAISKGMGLKAIASVIHPYPTRSDAIRKAADTYNRTRLTPGLRRILERFFAWRR